MPSTLVAGGLHVSQGTLLTVVLVLVIIALLFWLFGRFR